MTTGYLVKELGLFATDPDDGEILYAVTVDSNPDYLQDNTSATVITEALKLAIAVSNTSDVVATLDPEGLLTVEDMDIHNADEDAHDGILQKVSTLLADVVTHLASSAAISISSLNTNSVFYRLLQYALTAAGVQYNFTNSSAWYICLGALFGGLIIQGGRGNASNAGYDNTLPLIFNLVTAVARSTLTLKCNFTRNTISAYWVAFGWQ